MAYNGRWKTNQRFTPPPGANPNLGSGARREHLDPVEPENGFPEPTPVLPESPAYLYALDDFMLPAPSLPGAPPLDREPQSHMAGTVDRGETLLEGQQLAAAAHSVDRGVAEVHHFDDPIQRSVADTYQTQRIEAERAVSGSRMALVRGRNSYPENNPDGPPDQGHYVMRWIDRQFTRRGIRPDMQPLRPYRAAVAAQLPEPGHGQANAYTSPFRSLATARLRKLTTPEIRRVPRPPDEYAQNDGTDDPQYSAPVYWEY